MASPSMSAQDRLVWLGLGITTLALIGIMREMLHNSRKAAIIPRQPDISKQIDQDVEDAVKAETLEKLLDSCNYSIHETASTIICERALHDSKTISTLLWHISRPEYEIREKGVRSLSMITSRSTIELVKQVETYASLVQCLEYSVNDYIHNAYDPYWDNWHLRDVVERSCLQILAMLVERYGVEELVIVGFIHRWLVKEPWGDTPQSSFLQSIASNDHLSYITRSLFLDPTARQELKSHGLLSHHFPNCAHPPGDDTRMVNGEGTSGEAVDMINMEINRPRQRAFGIQEEHMRRRHREAMVFNDGTRPFERGDIIERGH